MSHIDKHSPSVSDWLELLDALRGEARAGRLKSLTFMLEDGNPDRAIVDYFGTPELTEIACRKAVESIATAVEVADSSLARAIRAGMPSGGLVQ